MATLINPEWFEDVSGYMQIQAQLIFSQDEVTCAPVDPKLSEYRDRFGFDDPSLDFRIRLFGARVRKGAATTRVALVLPADCVLRAERTAADMMERPDHGEEPREFCGIPEDELRIITAGPPDAPYQIAVECSAFDEVIAFARAYGLDPVAVLIPDGDEKITVPIKNEDPAPENATDEAAQSRCENSAIEIPPALQRELDKRKMLEQRQTLRANKRWSLGKLIQSGGDELPADKAPAGPEPVAPDAPRQSPLAMPEPAQAVAISIGTHDTPVQPITQKTQTASDEAALVSANLTDDAPIAEPPSLAAYVATLQAAQPSPDQGPCTTPNAPEGDTPPQHQAEHVAAEPDLAPQYDAPDDVAQTPVPSSTPHRVKAAQTLPRPMLAMGLAACTGIIGLGVIFQLGGDHTATPDADAVALTDTQFRPPPPVTTVAAATQTPARQAPAPQVMADAPHSIGMPNEALITTASNSGLHMPAMGSEQPGGAALIATPRIAEHLPQRVILASDMALTPQIAGFSETGLPQDEAPLRSSAVFPQTPSISQLAPPVIAESGSGGVRLAAARSFDVDHDTPVTLPPTRSENMPGTIANAIPPEPRPAISRTQDQAAVMTRARSIPAVPTASLLGPERAPRPLERPVAIPAPVLLVPTPERVAAPSAEPLPERQDALPQVIARASVPGFRVLAIIGSDQQRQALVQTGPNQTAVLVAGSTTRRWQVIEVRRDGVVLSINGQQRLLPIGL